MLRPLTQGDCSYANEIGSLDQEIGMTMKEEKEHPTSIIKLKIE